MGLVHAMRSNGPLHQVNKEFLDAVIRDVKALEVSMCGI
jgi:hypothetical protein